MPRVRRQGAQLCARQGGARRAIGACRGGAPQRVSRPLCATCAAPVCTRTPRHTRRRRRGKRAAVEHAVLLGEGPAGDQRDALVHPRHGQDGAEHVAQGGGTGLRGRGHDTGAHGRRRGARRAASTVRAHGDGRDRHVHARAGGPRGAALPDAAPVERPCGAERGADRGARVARAALGGVLERARARRPSAVPSGTPRGGRTRTLRMRSDGQRKRQRKR